MEIKRELLMRPISPPALPQWLSSIRWGDGRSIFEHHSSPYLIDKRLRVVAVVRVGQIRVFFSLRVFLLEEVNKREVGRSHGPVLLILLLERLEHFDGLRELLLLEVLDGHIDLELRCKVLVVGLKHVDDVLVSRRRVILVQDRRDQPRTRDYVLARLALPALQLLPQRALPVLSDGLSILLANWWVGRVMTVMVGLDFQDVMMPTAVLVAVRIHESREWQVGRLDHRVRPLAHRLLRLLRLLVLIAHSRNGDREELGKAPLHLVSIAQRIVAQHKVKAGLEVSVASHDSLVRLNGVLELAQPDERIANIAEYLEPDLLAGGRDLVKRHTVHLDRLRELLLLIVDVAHIHAEAPRLWVLLVLH
mmetsp:Transcript_100279/g.286723  ORF Transcript_100279/g.286723 Transcript_100279/m.286723 type:complete len:363 (-) Transcript_100279:648-1736(-)